MAAFANSIVPIFGSAAIGELLTRLSYLLLWRNLLDSSVLDKLEKLKEVLIKINNVVKAAAGKEIKNENLMQWLMQLKDVAYEADDLLDTFEYRWLENQADEDEKSWQPTPSILKSLFSHGGGIEDLSNIAGRLERIASNVGSFVQFLRLEGQSKKHTVEQRIGASPAFRHSFVGRMKEKEEIINILLRTESCGVKNVPVLPILGISGTGKTTLAQVIYNDERVKSHFSLRMWVCVSDKLSVFRLTKEIFNQAGCHSGVTSFNKLQEILKKKLNTEKFLLILDDVRNEIKSVWDTLKAPLCNGNKGSKILLTSRVPKVAKLMGTLDPIELEGFPRDQYRSFLAEYEFGGANLKKHHRGKKLASELEDLPLAAKTAGALRKDKLDASHWDSISMGDIYELEKGQDHIMAALKQKYLHLPPHLQQCFAYLNIYPKEWSFKREDVIQMWMAQGMIYQDHDKRILIKDIGKDYFKELVSKSFFQSSDDDDHYTIPNLLHDLAESVSKDDCFRVEGDEFRTIPTTIRHLFINTKHLASLKENAYVLNKLRTLILRSDFPVFPNDADHLQEVIIQLKSIRSLTLKNCNLKRCPYNLSSLTHLRYLDLSGNGKIRELPKELTKLYNLQTLNLFQLEVDSMPASMHKLLNLQNLICSSRVLSMVAGIGKMIQLQQLMCPFHVQNVPGFDIEQLKYLSQLRGYLSIRHLENVKSREQAEEARLWKKMNLVELELHWGSVKRKTNPEVENGILEGLQPLANLKKLHIDGYKGTRSPSWMVRYFCHYDLVSVKLTDCKAWEDISPLGQLPRLQVLELCEMHAVREVGDGFPGSGFKSLRVLIFDDLRELEVLSAVDEVDLFPCLQILCISKCPKLTIISPLPPTLQRLELFNVGLKEFPKFLAKKWALASSSFPLPSSLVTLSIKGCPKLQSPGEWLLEQYKNLRQLEELTVDPCGELNPSLVEAINEFIGLRKLRIDSWPSEQNLEEEEEDLKYEEKDCGLLLESLKSLQIINCVVADKILSKTLEGLSTLQSLRIDWCSGPTTLSFEEGLQKLTRLHRLEITNYRGLTSLMGLGALCSLQYLKVVGCPELTPLSSSGLKEMEEVGLSALSTLCIDNTLLLKVLLNGDGLASLKQLEIIFSDQQEIDEEVLHPLISLQLLRFEACDNLGTLPALKNLHSLKNLEIEDCSNFRSLPSKEDLPPLLVHMSVRRCHPEFNDRYNLDDGSD
ncbi:putative disease resistance protein RGA1 [Typha latifolia]|uniref:putative disease resistance protein RGA1 n=1 Tax=Typha latifolia TaxID=4733 RepID=UPI003C307619